MKQVCLSKNHNWFVTKLSGEVDQVLKPVYEVMPDYAEKAIK